MKRGAIMGLDLSLTCSAAVVIRPRWELGEWRTLWSMTSGRKLPTDASENERVVRLVDIVTELREFAISHDVQHVFVEQYAFSRGQSQAHAIGELGGAVKIDFVAHRLPVPLPIVASQARKFLFGNVPRKDAKKYVIARLVEMGAEFDTDDEADAFVIANYGLSELGFPALSIAV